MDQKLSLPEQRFIAAPFGAALLQKEKKEHLKKERKTK